jgi:hypothetical protein
VLLFANGVWMVGKGITGGKRGQIQVGDMVLAAPAYYVSGVLRLFACNNITLLVICPKVLSMWQQARADTGGEQRLQHC